MLYSGNHAPAQESIGGIGVYKLIANVYYSRQTVARYTLTLAIYEKLSKLCVMLVTFKHEPH